MDTNSFSPIGGSALAATGWSASGPVALGSLAALPRWCSWRSEPRRGDGIVTKMPYGANYTRAKSNNPATWLPLDQALKVAFCIHADDKLGIFMGPLGDGSGLALCGIDLDLCMGEDGAPLPWAQEIAAALTGAYCEVSPSGRGLKLYALVRESDLAAIRAAAGFASGADGRHWKQPVPQGVKAAGIEAYVGRRWFAITTRRADLDRAWLGVAGVEAWATVADIARRHFGGRREASLRSEADGSLHEPVVYSAIGEAEQALLDTVLVDGSKLGGLWTGDDAARERWLGADKSDSTLMFVLTCGLRAAGLERDVAATALRDCEALADFWEKHAWDADRQFARAWAKGASRVDVAGIETLDVSGPAKAESEAPVSPAGLSDDAMARWMVQRHGRDLRFDTLSGEWFKWDGCRWQLSSRTEVTGIARKACKEVAFLPSTKPDQVHLLLALKKIKAVEELARTDDDVQIRYDQWDCDPWKLNTPGGVVDLRTGELLKHDRNYHLRKMTAVTPDFTGEPTRWLEFMKEITPGYPELAGFLQRVAGYCLTGIVREHDMFFFYGGGRNGKGTFLNTLLHLLGLRDYAKVADQDTFTASRQAKHTTDLASMAGCRMVVVPETEEGAEWDERRVKAVTGGDPITARFMRRDNFTFDPAFKLIVSGNNKPTIKVVDTAIRSRMNLIPFLAVFEDGVSDDKMLMEKLQAEHPRILAWAICGCLEWQQTGMQKPAVVRAATEAYLSAEDTKQAWFDECCMHVCGLSRQAPLQTPRGLLYQSWKTWIEAAGAKAGTAKDLYAWFEKRGFAFINSKANVACVKDVSLISAMVSGYG